MRYIGDVGVGVVGIAVGECAVIVFAVVCVVCGFVAAMGVGDGGMCVVGVGFVIVYVVVGWLLLCCCC